MRSLHTHTATTTPWAFYPTEVTLSIYITNNGYLQKICGRNKHGHLSISPTHSTEAQLLATLIMSPSLIQENNWDYWCGYLLDKITQNATGYFTCHRARGCRSGILNGTFGSWCSGTWFFTCYFIRYSSAYDRGECSNKGSNDRF